MEIEQAMAGTRVEQSYNGWNGEYIDAMYARWTADPASVDEQWRHFFDGFELALSGVKPATATNGGVAAAREKQGQVDDLIYAYRDIGHLAASLDPLGSQRPAPAALQLEHFGLSESDLDAPFDGGTLPVQGATPLRDIVELLQDTYCRTIGVEFMHIQNPHQRRWLQERMEAVRNRPVYTHEQKLHIVSALSEANAFESFLNTRFTGKKRFGIDGGESLIPLLDDIIESGPDNGVTAFTIGMAHRGRLNVLVNILHKTYDQIFTEFDESWSEDFLRGGGDVKYHRGYSTNHACADGRSVRLNLSPNPSHLEFVNAVVLGRARAKQRLRNDTERRQCVPLLIHGDASFPGQGVVAECLNMVRLDGYTVGGSIHVVINNQIGFTTSPHDAHSGIY
jgi:2-oxoglutarate dehydrogenase E1 component